MIFGTKRQPWNCHPRMVAAAGTQIDKHSPDSVLMPSGWSRGVSEAMFIDSAGELVELSGGERQREAFVRAFLAKNNIVAHTGRCSSMPRLRKTPAAYISSPFAVDKQTRTYSDPDGAVLWGCESDNKLRRHPVVPTQASRQSRYLAPQVGLSSRRCRFS